ncbi:hypothetical protein MEA186_07444 [Mesorhizobium amorphae CCNWGS0123]|uniref:Uncharacterized protein n=1 Tax=Mesorhizobium amorphae CCNWGS0123 TaxID=1082933 RepID=G6Y6C4_9HYPH|nr:hypothetical protein MEA186_07444 [Mesorhizobium amorphae CCNWGS0123]
MTAGTLTRAWNADFDLDGRADGGTRLQDLATVERRVNANLPWA